jgi:hypothetical protein
MQSPAPEKQRIRRSDPSESTDDIIENIEAVTEEDKKEEAEYDSSDSTITEREIEEDKDSPKTDGGSKKAVEALEVSAIPAFTSGVVGTSKSSSSSSTSTSSSSSSSSTGGSDKSGDISSSDSFDSSRSYSDSESDSSTTDNKKYKYNEMPSSIIKSPVSDGSRATFEEWHSLWEVFGQEQGFDEYQTIVSHPDLLVDGHNAVKLVKTEKKALRKNKKAIASLRVSFSGIYTADAMIEGTIDDAGMWPYGRIHLALVVLYETYWPKS